MLTPQERKKEINKWEGVGRKEKERERTRETKRMDRQKIEKRESFNVLSNYILWYLNLKRKFVEK